MCLRNIHFYYLRFENIICDALLNFETQKCIFGPHFFEAYLHFIGYIFELYREQKIRHLLIFNVHLICRHI